VSGIGLRLGLRSSRGFSPEEGIEGRKIGERVGRPRKNEKKERDGGARTPT